MDIKDELHQTDIDKVTYQLFLKAVKKIAKADITSRAPLGYSSNSFMLHGKDRISEVSIRNHSNMFSMLVTTPERNFLFNGGFSMGLKAHVAAKSLYQAFKQVKPLVANK